MRGIWCAIVLTAGVCAGPPSLAAQASMAATDELHALRGYDTSGDPEAALRHVDEVLARAARDRRVDPVDLLYAQAVRAQALSSLDRTEEALALFQSVDAGLEARHAPPTPDRAGLLLHIGSELGALGKLDEAEAYTRRALDLAARLEGRQSAEYGAALYGLGLIEYQRGRQLEAIAPIAEAVEIARVHALTTGEDLDAPASRGISLAALQLYASDADTAVVTARAAAVWAEEHLPENHRVRVTTTQQLGTILSEAGQYAQAIPILRAALEKRRAILSPDSPQLAISLHSLAYALDNAGMRAEAGPLYDRAVEILEANPDRLQANGIAMLIGQQARMARWEGNAPKALALREKALAAARKYSASPDDMVVLNCELGLAAALLDARRTAEALPLIAHARDGLAKVTGPKDKRRNVAAALAARVMADEGRPAEAMALLAAQLAPLRASLLDRATARSDVTAIATDSRSSFMQLVGLALQASGQPGAKSGAQAQAFDALQMANLGDLQGAFSSLAVLQDDYGPQAQAAIRRYLALAAQGRQLRKTLDRATIAGDRAEAASLAAQVATLDAQLRTADAEVAALVPGYRALTAVEPARLADARARLRPGQGLLLIGSDDTGLVSQLVTRDAVVIGQSRVAPQHLIALQQRLRASVEAGLLDEGHAGFDRKAAYELYGLVFPPAI
ncbi:MAG TPA: tetratricopeptide repeat protein, partial [Novosphingobium sp.]|nr:tetratricopeptide repeat protein [Novosphingobium sp.]